MYAEIIDFKNRLSVNDYYNQIYEGNDNIALDDLITANATVDAFIASRYCVPVTDQRSLPLLKSWTLTLAEELAWCRTSADSVPESVTNRVKNIRQILQNVADGKMQLSAKERHDSTNGAIIVDCNTPIMTRDNLNGY